MARYELSIEADLIAEAERLISLEARVFPTIVIAWESRALGQDWETRLVFDYAIPLPPLEHGGTFNEVRIAAYTDDVPTKFLYFGSELSQDAPRIAPEMENLVSPARSFQEYRLSEDTCEVSYLDLINTTPRIYGNGPQDYYAPAIKVERFDAGSGADMISDNFPKIAANLPVVTGEQLVDPRHGFWNGSRFVGTKKIAILRDGKVVGLRRRMSEKEVVPPEVVRRDPHVDVQDAWVAIDLGVTTTTVATGNGESSQLVRLGATKVPAVSADYENPSEISFINLPRVTKAWRDRVILPLTEWGDLYVGHAARDRRQVHGRERALRTRASLAELGSLPLRHERGLAVHAVGRQDLDATVRLEAPAPPIIDEEGISPDDPFDPLEVYAYYIGLHLNNRQRGVHLRYAIGMPTGWPAERREKVVVQFRRGILRSLPAGMVAFDDMDLLQVVDAGPNVLSFAAYAFRVFGISPRPSEPVPFVSIDAGGSELSILCGQYRIGTNEEAAAGASKIMEHVEPAVLTRFGGEHLLHRMAYKVYSVSNSSMRSNAIPFMLPEGEEALAGAEERFSDCQNAQLNVRLLKDAVRAILEKSGPTPVPDVVQLFDSGGRPKDVRVMVDRATLSEWLRGQLSEAAVEIKEAIVRGFEQVTRAQAPYNSLRILLGGRVGMNPILQERLEAVLPAGVRIHRFREPDDTNLAAPTVKLATGLGILLLRHQPMRPAEVSDDRATFGYLVGRNKRGRLHVVLNADSGYDVWRELGACNRPEVTVLFVNDTSNEDVPSDHPGIIQVTCDLGYDAVGYRTYLRAVNGSQVEVSVGPPSGQPDEDAPRWCIDLTSGSAQPVNT